VSNFSDLKRLKQEIGITVIISMKMVLLSFFCNLICDTSKIFFTVLYFFNKFCRKILDAVLELHSFEEPFILKAKVYQPLCCRLCACLSWLRFVAGLEYTFQTLCTSIQCTSKMHS